MGSLGMFDVRRLRFDVKEGSARVLRASFHILRNGRYVTNEDGSPQNAANCAHDARALPIFALYPIERFLGRFEGAFELARFDGFQDFPKSWTRFHS